MPQMKDDEIYVGSQPRELTMFEWDLLTGAWRYYEHGANITSAGIPGDIVRHYWGGNYSEESRMKIVNQFVHDHSLRGESDWDSADPMDATPWLKFFNFCWGAVHGFAMVSYTNGSGRTLTMPAFRAHVPVDRDGGKEAKWYFLHNYLDCPDNTSDIQFSETTRILSFGGFNPDIQ